jgi:hypothetical protein
MLVVACGGTGPSATPGPTLPGSTPAGATLQPGLTVDACTVLSDAEIQAATGESVVERQLSDLRPDVFPSICDIELDGGGSLTVSVRASGGRSLYETSFEPFIGDDDGYLDEAILGLGDKAGSSGGDAVMVLKGDVLFEVMYFAFGSNDELSVARYLSEIVLAKLPCLATGCVGFTPPPPPSTAAAIDLCALLTDEEIEQATGFKPSEHDPATEFGSDASCYWTLSTGEVFPGRLTLNILESGGAEEFGFLTTAYDPPLEHIAGLGDDAVQTATIPDGAIYALVGDRLVTLEFSVPLSIDDPYALVESLMALALSRM